MPCLRRLVWKRRWRFGVGVVALAVLVIAAMPRNKDYFDTLPSIGSASNRPQKKPKPSGPNLDVGGWLILPLLFSLVWPRTCRNHHHHVRGNELGTHDPVRQNADAARNGRSGLVWGGVEYPAGVAERHFLALGATGSGKTTLFDILTASHFDCYRRERFRAVAFE
jgi:hypothetical protein